MEWQVTRTRDVEIKVEGMRRVRRGRQQLKEGSTLI